MKPSKKLKVLTHLKKHKTITSWEAIQMFKYTRLADAIFVLKEDGHNIITNMITRNGSTFAEYTLIQENIDA